MRLEEVQRCISERGNLQKLTDVQRARVKRIRDVTGLFAARDHEQEAARK